MPHSTLKAIKMDSRGGLQDGRETLEVSPRSRDTSCHAKGARTRSLGRHAEVSFSDGFNLRLELDSELDSVRRPPDIVTHSPFEFLAHPSLLHGQFYARAHLPSHPKSASAH